MGSNSPIRTKRLGAWSVQEDVRLITYMQNRDRVYWSDVPEAAGLIRSSNSCRTRWLQHLSPDIKHHNFTVEEENYMIRLYRAGFCRSVFDIWSCLLKTASVLLEQKLMKWIVFAFVFNQMDGYCKATSRWKKNRQ